MMRVLTIGIPDDVDEALREIALREFRRPRDQASVLLIEAVRRVQDERLGEVEATEANPRAQAVELSLQMG